MDRRVNKTKQSIQDAFFELIAEKPLKDIRIVDICKRADINRSSFYAHYEDFPCFIKSMKNEIVKKMLEIIDLYSYNTDTEAMLNGLMTSLKKNKNLFSLMYHYKELDVWEACKKRMNERTIPIWKRESDLSTEEIRLLLEYMHSGIFRLLELWFESDTAISEERFLFLFDGIVKYGVYNFIYTK